MKFSPASGFVCALGLAAALSPALAHADDEVGPVLQKRTVEVQAPVAVTVAPVAAATAQPAASPTNATVIVVPQGCTVHTVGATTEILCPQAQAPIAPAAPVGPAPAPRKKVQITESYAGYTLLGLGIGGLLGSITVHCIHDNCGNGATALGVYAGGLFGGLLVGGALGSAMSSKNSDGGRGGMMIGALLGVGTAMVIDIAVLSKRKIWVDADSNAALNAGVTAKRKTEHAAKPSILPNFGPTLGGAQVGATGTF
jgi:hypothetical protein